jgi:hypothetical protein
VEYGTEYGKRLAAELLGRPNAIARLYAEWRAGNLGHADLRDLLPQIWTRESTDSPEAVAGTAACVQLFRSAGFIAIPNDLKKPGGALTIYRGAPESHRIGMAWTQSETIAGHFRDGKRRRLGVEAFVFQASAGEDAVLALFDDRREREVVIDPALITDVRRVLHPTGDGDARQC